MGGMAKAIESGLPKMKIEEASAIKQARIDSMEEVIVGVNKYQSAKDNKNKIDILDVDNSKVRLEQIEKLTSIKKNRNQEEVEIILHKITEACKTTSTNLLELAVEAARKRATLGEISDAMEKVFGRYKADNKTISGVYIHNMKKDKDFEKAIELSDEFAKKNGRRPRILIAKMGQDGHDRGAKVIATSFADIGFDVDMGPLFSTPAEAAKMAIENDVHIVGVSSLAAGHKTLVPELMAELKKYNREDILVIVGGVIPEQDYPFLFDQGVAAIFGPGTKIPLAAGSILKLLLE
jgi:methylmalonyl-CoA mutase